MLVTVVDCDSYKGIYFDDELVSFDDYYNFGDNLLSLLMASEEKPTGQEHMCGMSFYAYWCDEGNDTLPDSLAVVKKWYEEKGDEE